jgi:poly(A) polymerase
MLPSFLNTVASVSLRLHTDLYIVGGTVRDRLLGRDSRDWDFVGRQALNIAKAVARQHAAKMITLDEHHRIYRVILPGPITLDFAELQGKTLEQDLARRDFSINAMAMPLTPSSPRLPASRRTSGDLPPLGGEGVRVRGLIDPLGGQKDLRKKTLRALSQKAFQEDPLRLLRAYRMAAQFNLKIAPQTERWIIAEHRRLEGPVVARERVREEFLRFLSQPSSGLHLEHMDRSGLLTTLFPELEAGRRVGHVYYGKGGVIKHHLQSVANTDWLLERLHSSQGVGFITDRTIRDRVRAYTSELVGGIPRSAFLKLGALLHDVGKPATVEVIKGRLRFWGHEEVGANMVTKMLTALRCSRQETAAVRMWVRNHMRPGNLASVPHLTDKALARFFKDMGEDGVGMLIVSLGDHYTYLAPSQWAKGKDPVERTCGKLLEAYYLRKEAVLPPRVIDGHVLMKQLRLKPGPLIGKLLEAISDAQSGGIVKTVVDALKFARKKLGSPGFKQKITY